MVIYFIHFKLNAMKALRYIVLIIIIIYIVFSCTPKKTSVSHFQQVVLQSSGQLSKELLFSSKALISNRLKTLHIDTFEIAQNNEKSQLIVMMSDSINVQAMSTALTSKGEMNFCLALANGEVVSKLKKLDSNLKLAADRNVAALLSLLQANQVTSDNSPVIALVDANDTGLVVKCLNSESIRKLLADDVKFVWGNKANDQQKCALYAVLAGNAITGKTLNDASALVSQSYNIEINLSFNDEGSMKWKEMTGKNLGKSIAMLVDNKVYSAPTVRSEISNGKSVITGNFTWPEASNLAAILKNGVLPSSFILVK